jgi:hypothetical protein
MALATPPAYSPNAKTRRFGIRNHPKHTTHELQHTAGTTSAQCYPLGVRWRRVGSPRLQFGEIRMGPRHRQNGTQRRERHLGRSWWSLEWHVASSGRALLPSYPPFVTQRNLLNKGREKVNICRNAKHIYSSYLVALWMRVFKWPSDLQSGMWSETKVMIRKANKSAGDYERPQLTCSTSRRLEMVLIWSYHFLADEQYPSRDANF